MEQTASRSRSSPYFPPTRLSYYSSGPVYPFIGPVLPSVPAYLPPSSPYYQAHQQPDTLQDRVDAASLSVVSLLPSILKSVVVPVLAAGSAVWLSQNLPTPVVQQRKKRSSGGAQLPGNSNKAQLRWMQGETIYSIGVRLNSRGFLNGPLLNGNMPVS